MVSISVSPTRPDVLCVVGETENVFTLAPKEVYPQWQYFIPGPPAMAAQKDLG